MYRKAIYSKVLTFDPAQMTDTASLSVATQIFDGLLEFGDHFNVQPALAETWETSHDGKTLTFKLRKGIRFHDGSVVTSKDCVVSFERLLRKESRVLNYYNIIRGAADFSSGKTKTVTGLRAVDEYTFVIELENRFPPFTAILAGATAKILPSKLLSPSYFSKPVGTGPFKFSRSSDSEIVLVRNSNYWREPAKLASLHYVVADEAEGMKLADAGKLHDLVTYPLNGDEPIFSKGKNHFSIPVVATWIVGINTRIKPFNDLAIRKRFKKALRSKDFVGQLYPGQIDAGGGYIPPGLPGYLPPPSQSEKTEPGPVIRTPIEIVVPIELQKAQGIASFFSERLKQAGFVNAKVSTWPWDRLMKEYIKKSMQAFVMSMNADYPDTEFLMRNFETDNPDNFSGLSSKAIDSLLKQSRQTDSRIERAGIYERAAKEIENEAVTVNLLHYRAHYWFSDCVKGVSINSLGDVYIPYRLISLDPNCKETGVRNET